MFGCLALCCCLVFSTCIHSQVVSVRFGEVPAKLCDWLPGIKSTNDFDQLRESLNQRTADRLRQGQLESSVYMALQGRSFTESAPIEPAIAARQFIESGSIPQPVQSRFGDFIQACRQNPADARARAVCADSHAGADLGVSFQTVARFLYEKEIQSQRFQGDRRREFVDSLYRDRGLSSDSSFDASFPVYLALRQLAGHNFRVNRVLIIGPGLEFASRTGLDDSIPPQSIQPYAVADALLQLGIANRDGLQILCADINPRVVEYFQTQRAPKLQIHAHDGPDE